MADNHMTSQIEAQGFALEKQKTGAHAGTRKYESVQQVAVALVALKGALIANGFTATAEKINGNKVVCTFENDKQTVVTTQNVVDLGIDIKVS